jgi:hypothetical protein
MHKACRYEWHTSIHVWVHVCSADGSPCTHAVVRGCAVLTLHLIAVCHFGSTWCHLHLHAVDHVRLTAFISCSPYVPQVIGTASSAMSLQLPQGFSHLRLVLPWQYQCRVCALKLPTHAYWCAAASVWAAARAMCTWHCLQSSKLIGAGQAS